MHTFKQIAEIIAILNPKTARTSGRREDVEKLKAEVARHLEEIKRNDKK